MSDHKLHIEQGGFINKEKLFAYLRNELNDSEKQHVEKLIAQDPFLQDAVDGLKNADLNTIDNVLSSVFEKVDVATVSQKTNTFSANIRKYAAAASILLILGMSWVIINNLNNKQAETQAIASEETIIKADKNSAVPALDDSSDMGSGSAASDSISMDELAKESISFNRKKIAEQETEKLDETSYDFSYTEDVKSEKIITTEMIIAPPLIADENINLLSNNEKDDQFLDADKVVTAGSVATESVTLEEIDTGGDKDMVISTKKEKKVKTNASKSEKVADYTDQNIAPASRDDIATIYASVEQMPSYPGGTDSLNLFILNNLNTNCDGDIDCIPGNVFVKFIVNEDGSVSNAQILKPVSPQFDQEVLRVISIMPKWNPGINNGSMVKVWYTLKVHIDYK